MKKRISDSELLALVAEGNLEAKRILDRRYHAYCKAITKKFLENHPDYGFDFDDFLNAAILGYCRARNKFDYENSDGFYPYFKIWAESELKNLIEEGNRFFLNENPKKFVSFDLTYKDPEESISLSETCGNNDEAILSDIKTNEVLSLITDSSFGLTEQEITVCARLIFKHSNKEIRDELKLSYSEFRYIIKSIKSKIGEHLSDIFK